jgi:hypothetical protein
MADPAQVAKLPPEAAAVAGPRMLRVDALGVTLVRADQLFDVWAVDDIADGAVGAADVEAPGGRTDLPGGWRRRDLAIQFFVGRVLVVVDDDVASRVESPPRTPPRPAALRESSRPPRCSPPFRASCTPRTRPARVRPRRIISRLSWNAPPPQSTERRAKSIPSAAGLQLPMKTGRSRRQERSVHRGPPKWVDPPSARHRPMCHVAAVGVGASTGPPICSRLSCKRSN